MNTRSRLAAIHLFLVISLFASTVSILAAGSDKAVDDYNFAAWLYNTGKYQLAVESYEEFLENHPKHEKKADVLFGLAQSLFHQDKFAEAVSRYEALHKQYPDFPQGAEVLFQLGQSHVALEHFNEAASAFELTRKNFTSHYLADWATARQAACLVSLEKAGDAEALLTIFVDKYAPRGKKINKGTATKKMFKEMAEAGIKATETFLNLIERSVFLLGLSQFNQEKFEPATVRFTQFLETFASSSLAEEARFRLAQSQFRQDNFKGAAQNYKNVMQGGGEYAAAAAFELGLSLYRDNDLNAASDAFADMVKQFPKNPRVTKAMLYSGTFRYESGDYKMAIERLLPLADTKTPPADEAAYWIGMSFLKQNKADDAAKTFREAIQAYPKSSLAGDMQLGLADALLAQNDYNAAAKAFTGYADAFNKQEQAPHALYSACVALHRTDNYAESDRLCNQFIKQYSDHTLLAQAIFLGAENRFLSENYDAAAERYESYLKQKNGTKDQLPRVHFRLAWIHRYAKRNTDALKAIDRINLKQADPVITAESQYLKGICLFDLEQYKEAVAALNDYLDSQDHNHFEDDALFKSGMALIQLDERGKAARLLKRFLKNYADSDLSAHARYQLAECYFDTKDYKAAAEAYQTLTQRDTTDDLTAYAWFGLGLSQYEQNNWDAAAQSFEAVTKQSDQPDVIPQAFYRRGRALMKASQWEKATEAFNNLLKKHSKHDLARSAQVNLATCLQEQKSWENAAQAFDAAVRKFPAADDQPRLYYEQAWSWREAGNAEKSLAAFQVLSDKFPNDALAADAYFHLAEAKYQRADSGKDAHALLTEARALYAKVLTGTENSRLKDKALYRIGWCGWTTEDHAGAAKAFDRLITECPKSELLADALFQSGLCHAKLNDLKTAAKRLERLTGDSAFASFEYLPDALLARGDHLLALNEQEKAIKAIHALLAAYPNHAVAAKAYLIKGKAQYGLKRYDDAVETLTECTRNSRSEAAAEAQFYVGQAHQIREDYKHAVVAYLRVQALYMHAPEWVAASMFECGKCYQAQGQEQEAKDTFTALMRDHKGTQWAELAADRIK
ncbi:MAG: tetratricopeptide repeat protein [Kiritimatiellae bacterium]|nr:tetratricopeptide repeat protein [Kiritimatiellia bacterium]